jgi:GNAT superfamily N-acetyltransferase
VSYDVGLALEADLPQILALQAANLEPALGDVSDGFVTVVHTPEILAAMHALMPSVVARAEGRVAAYALSMPKETRALVPILASFFEKLDQLLPEERYYVMGQVCVDEAHRGSGVFDLLFAAHREHYASSFDCLVTEIATRNVRSLRAHARVGFETIATYRDAVDEWVVVAWRWGEAGKIPR